MHSIRSPLLGSLLGVGLLASACSPLTAVNIDKEDDGGAPDGAALDGSTTDSAATTDSGVDTGAPLDGSLADGGADGGLACGTLGGTYGDPQKICANAGDCVMVARGCYCGAQPVIGISKAFLAAAEACEKKVGAACPLGCATSPGRVAEDGKSDIDGGTITVLCDLGKCHTVLP